MDKVNRPARLRGMCTRGGTEEVLAPERYLERGTAVLLANQISLTLNPRRDILYPDWHARYWSEYNFFTKKVHEMDQLKMLLPGITGCIAEVHASVKTGTLVIKFQDSMADWDPDTDPGRLHNSELIYQTWRDVCTLHLITHPGDFCLKKLKYVIIDNIINQGTIWTIQDVIIAEGGSSVSMRAGNKQRITFERGANDTCSDWFKMLMGTANARPVARMCADHAQTLGKQVRKIYAWYNCPDLMIGALAFELEDVAPLPIQPNLPFRKQSRKDKLKAFGKSVMGSIKKAFKE